MDETYLTLINHLRQMSIDADIHTDRATRICCASDNSIHFKIPHAVIYPKNADAIVKLMQAISQDQPGTIEISCRGGGSSTCGQSLTSGLIIDCSRYMSRTLTLDLKNKWIKVQPGCRADTLQQELKKHDHYFPVRISSSAQATLGGMVNTDAAGIGSYRHGRMHQHVMEMTLILIDGSMIQIHRTKKEKIIRPGLANTLSATIKKAFKNHIIKPINQARHLNGYNIFHPAASESLIPIICGSEGTLAIIADITLAIESLPQDNWLSIYYFKQLDQALKISNQFKAHGANAIEFLDKHIINQIQLHQPEYLRQPDVGAMLLVEWHQQPPTDLDLLCLDVVHENNSKSIQALWSIRKQAVGWASQRSNGNARPIPFIEDMAVNPEKFHLFVRDVTFILEQKNIQYAMYGHADAGCLHLRPILDPHQEMDLIMELTKTMIHCLEQYQGCLCGEHGHGYRSQWVTDFFSPQHIHLLRKIKQTFDPHDQLCRGQIISANTNHHIKSMDQDLINNVNLNKKQQASNPNFENTLLTNSILNCNGNARCLNQNPSEVICPSYHISHNPLHSPRSRALMLKDYLENPNDPTLVGPLLESLEYCLGCHACTKGGCPMSVNIPRARSDFYQQHYNQTGQHRSRPKIHKLLSNIESLLAHVQQSRIIHWLSRRWIIHQCIQLAMGFSDLPKPSRIHLLPSTNTQQSNTNDKNDIYIIPDMLNIYFEPEIIQALIIIGKQIEQNIVLLPLCASGIIADSLGYYQIRDKQLMRQSWHHLKQSQLIVIEPSIALYLRKNAEKDLIDRGLKIMSPQEWLITHLASIQSISPHRSNKTYHLFPHCHEQSLAPENINQWQIIFQQLGQKCQIHQTGCCGMAGTWGLEKNKKKYSQACFEQHIKPHQEKIDPHDIILNSGFSCLMQNKRYSTHKAIHPLLAIKDLMVKTNN